MTGHHRSLFALLMFAGACVDPPQPVPPPPVPAPELCPAGFGPYESLTDGCYAEVGVGEWVKAEQACEEFSSRGKAAHLIVIDREEEHVAISNQAYRTGLDAWIGRLQQDSDDAYRNINYVVYDVEHFGEGEPNDFGNTNNCDNIFGCGEGRPGGGDERCIEYKHETAAWNDEKCFREDRVICEWDGVAPYEWRPDGD